MSHVQDEYKKCQICAEDFSVAEPLPGEDDRRPISLNCCGEVICHSCFSKHQATEMTKLKGRAKKVPCMLCTQKGHNNFVLSRYHMQILVAAGVQQPRQAPNTSGTRSGTRATESADDQVQHNEATSSSSANAPSSNIEPQRVGKRARKRTEQHVTERSSSAFDSSTNARGRRPKRRLVRREDHEASPPNDGGSGPHRNSNPTAINLATSVGQRRNDDEEWTSAARGATKLFRIRQFTKASITTDDPYGRKCTEWSIQNGYVASSSRALASSAQLSGNAERAMKYLRETDVKEIKDACRSNEYWEGNQKQLTRYCNGYKMFAKMSKGDIVTVILPGATGKGEACFGVILSDELELMSPDEALKKGFPASNAKRIFEELDPPRFNGIMLRKVKWLRRCYMRQLPQQTVGSNGAPSLSWLLESSAFWIAEASRTQNGLSVIQTRAFLNNTENVN